VARYPDVSELKGTEDFILVYPKYYSGPPAHRDAFYTICDNDGEPVVDETRIDYDIKTQLGNFGVGVASNNIIFSCVYSKWVSTFQSNTYCRQFLHSGVSASNLLLLDDLEDSSPDGTFRVTMLHDNQNTIFASENRCEIWNGGHHDVDIITCGYPFRGVISPNQVGESSGYTAIDPTDRFGEDDNYDNDATSLESYPAHPIFQFIMYSWTQEEDGGDNLVFARAARYNNFTDELVWLNDPVQLSTQHAGDRADVWTDVDLTEDNDFLVVWNQVGVNNDDGIWVCKLDYQGNILSGYPKPIWILDNGEKTIYPSIVTFQTTGLIKYVVTWGQKNPEEDDWNIIGVPMRENDNPFGFFEFRVTNETKLLTSGGNTPQHKMDSIYSPNPNNVRFAIIWAGEHVYSGTKDIYYAVYQIQSPGM